MTTKDKNPRFTVIIPTKDRAEFLRHTLNTCAFQEYDNLEVLVSDDGSLDNTREVVEEAARQDTRIKYITPDKGGMLNNFEFALAKVKPGYVIALGGDDGLLPHSISDMRNILFSTGKDIVTWAAPVYIYPGARDAEGQLILKARLGRPLTGQKIVQSTDFLERQAQKLFYVSDIESPMLYVKSVVSTELVNMVKARSINNRFYSCPVPDGYSGVVLAGETPDYVFSGEPLSLFGASPLSAGLTYASDSSLAKKVSSEFFNNASDLRMHKNLGSQPYSPLIALMTVDFLLTARDLPGWRGRFSEIDYKKVLINSLLELADGCTPISRLPRELSILRNIAEHNGLGGFFRAQLEKVRRNKRTNISGSAASHYQIYLNATSFGIRNIEDAAHITRFLHKSSARFGLGAIGGAALNSLKHFVKSRLKGPAFPPEAEWPKHVE